MNYSLTTPIIRQQSWVPVEPKPHPVPIHSGQETQDHRAYSWLISRQPKAFLDRPQSGRKK
jgi:hypothetical protein